MVLKNSNIYRYIGLLVLLVVMYPSHCNYGQEIPASSIGNLTFYLDHASFYGNDENTYVEFYLMFYEDQLTKLNKNDLRTAELKIKSVIENEKDNFKSEREWITEIDFSDESTNSVGKVIYDMWTEHLKSADYKIRINASDNFGNSSGEINKNLRIENIGNRCRESSDIQFVSSIEQSQQDGHFTKGNLKVLPNPSRRYGILNPKMYFYYEVYGLTENDGELNIDYKILDQNKSLIKELNNISVNKPGASATIVHGIDITGLKSGIYELNVLVKDPGTTEDLFISRKFEIVQADFFRAKTSITEEHAEIFQTILSYIGTSQQLNLYKSLNLTGKAEYMVQYWQNLDPDPSTPENEYLIEIQNRFNHAKNKFGWYNVKGWDTDRGRICIKYGIPHQINQYNTEANTAPFEVWIYNENRTYEFIFADPRSNGRYILVHSNREGEIYNSNWRETIQRM